MICQPIHLACRRDAGNSGTSSASARTARRQPKGTILIVTIWLMLVLAGLVLMLASAMQVEGVCSGNKSSSLQADAVEQGAIQYVLARVDSLQGLVPVVEDMPCQAVQVGQGAFWIIRPDYENDLACTYGLVDEAGKLNLNTAPLAVLSKAPGMTAELAACIIDWRDKDSNVTPNGAESEYYTLLENPHECKNAPLESVEEMLLVKDASMEIVFGEDANRNGALDANEDDAEVSAPSDNRDGRLDRGLFPFVTVYSTEPNTAAGGGRRINVNDSETGTLSTLLRKQLSRDRADAVLGRVRQGRPFRNVLDFFYRTGLTFEEFQPIADQLTVSSDNTLKGLINVNTAPREVLACLPGLDESHVSSLLARRSETDVDLSSIAWVTQALQREQAVAIGNSITCRSYQFSADVVSIAGNGRAFRRCRIVVDAQTTPPKVIYRRDLTQLGWPLSQDILTKLRAGVAIEEIARTRRDLLESTR